MLRTEVQDPSFLADVEMSLANAKLELAREGTYPETKTPPKAEVVIPDEVAIEASADSRITITGKSGALPRRAGQDEHKVREDSVVRMNPGQIDYAGPVIENKVGIPADQWNAARQALHRDQRERAKYLLLPWLKQHDAEPDLLAQRWAAWAKLLQYVAENKQKFEEEVATKTALGAK